ncbi:MAG: hypothetical protein QM682_00165 [Paracoccus sp. (in: a-proteobacteria)]|uniref:hypothetical protein n=1 Tax=Paracoccus sp. TaxID=267 RepID=UPI0039E311B7
MALHDDQDDSQVIRIGDGALNVIANPIKLDGRSSSHPLDVRGWTTMNTFLLIEGDHALVYSTGFTAHRASLMRRLRELVGDRKVSMAIPRVEWASMCNARAIADTFEIDAIYQRVEAPPELFLDFHADSVGPSRGLTTGRLVPMVNTLKMAVHPDRPRALEFLVPELRLLPSNWGYDPATKTLFTGDTFSWVWQDSVAGPWFLDSAKDDPTTLERVIHQLTHGRYWWLPGAETGPIREALDETFAKFDIAFIAPDHGPVLAGEAVARHIALLDQCLAEVEKRPSIGVAAGQWTISSMRNA